MTQWIGIDGRLWRCEGEKLVEQGDVRKWWHWPERHAGNREFYGVAQMGHLNVVGRAIADIGLDAEPEATEWLYTQCREYNYSPATWGLPVVRPTD